jgi:hypothetical protein
VSAAPGAADPCARARLSVVGHYEGALTLAFGRRELSRRVALRHDHPLREDPTCVYRPDCAGSPAWPA